MWSRIWEFRQTWKQVPDYRHYSLFFLVGRDIACRLAKLPMTVSSAEQTGICRLNWGECGLRFSLFSPKCFYSPTWGSCPHEEELP